MKSALVLVDLQNDFMPGGSLPVEHGDQVIPVVNKALKMPFDIVVATKDWHPADHTSFAPNHEKLPGEVILLEEGNEQIMWPIHCVQGSQGAQFYPGWDTSKVQKIFYKGTDKNIDSYSTFFDNMRKKSTGLVNFLKTEGVKDIYILGLTTEYCVKYSALDALELGFNVFVIKDGCRGVNLSPHDAEEALAQMKEEGAHLIRSDEISLKK